MDDPGQRRAFVKWVNSPRVAGWLMLLASVVAGLVALGHHRDATALRDRGITVEAVVTGVDEARSSYVVLRFRAADDREVTAEVRSFLWSPRPRVGDTPTVVYDPDDPRGSVTDARIGPDFFAAWLLAAVSAVLAVVAGLAFTRRLRWMTDPR